MKHKIFVYGTLLSGMHNHKNYLFHSKFLAEAEIDGYVMYDLDFYPGIVKGDGKVKGEIYEVDDETLKDIDYLEDNGNLYIREKVSSEYGEIYLYVYNRPIEDYPQIPYEMQPYSNLIYYVSYGSNMLSDRFKSYIKGGRCIYNNTYYKGCTNKCLPIKELPAILPYDMFYARSSASWDGSPVSFIDYSREGFAYGKAYLITREQFEEINEQEGISWYGNVIKLDPIDGLEAYTFTTDDLNLTREEFSQVGESYSNVLKLALKETFPNLFEQEIDEYLENCGKQRKFNL